MHSWAAECRGVGTFVDMQSSITSTTINNSDEEESSRKLSYPAAAPMSLRGSKDYYQDEGGGGRRDTDTVITYSVSRGVPGITTSSFHVYTVFFLAQTLKQTYISADSHSSESQLPSSFPCFYYLPTPLYVDKVPVIGHEARTRSRTIPGVATTQFGPMIKDFLYCVEKKLDLNSQSVVRALELNGLQLEDNTELKESLREIACV